MTNEEAIKTLHELWRETNDPWYEEVYNIAIEALQREIPKNPIVNYVADSDGARRLNNFWTEDSLLCPVCHTYFGAFIEEGYCQECGQKLIQKKVRVIKP